MINKHILIVMQWLDNHKSVSREELGYNSRDAMASIYYGNGMDGYINWGRYHATCAVAYFACAVSHSASKPSDYYVVRDSVNMYFYDTGENQQDYLDHLENTK